MSIYREGRGTIAIVAAFLIVINLLYAIFLGQYFWPGLVLQAGSIFLMILVLQFFRNPERHIVENEYVVLSAADGEVVAIEEVDESEYFKTKCLQVSVFMSVWNVHSNRWPISGDVTYFKHHEGKYLIASHPKSSSENEHTSISDRRCRRSRSWCYANRTRAGRTLPADACRERPPCLGDGPRRRRMGLQATRTEFDRRARRVQVQPRVEGTLRGPTKNRPPR